MMDIVKYLFRYIPPSLTIQGELYQFQIFINHPHYDLRFCYSTLDGDKFKYLVENIDNEKELLQDLKTLRAWLKRDGALDDDYASPQGYTQKKYRQWIDNHD